jgi:hypothetical protein
MGHLADANTFARFHNMSLQAHMEAAKGEMANAR